YEALFEEAGGARLGLALMRAKAAFFEHNSGPGSGSNTNSEKYHLLGDPLMRLAMPELPVEISAASSDTLYALTQANLSGQILTQSGSPITNFSGIVQVQVFDTRIPIYYGFNNAPPPTIPTYYLPGNLIFRGDCSVQGGQFQATFIVPVDINYGGAGGRYSLLVYSDEISGSGANDSVVFAPSATSLQDSIPPQVSLYFDSPAFRSGEQVNPEAVLYVQVSDSHGVNLTGSTGHGIVVTIDGQNPIDLTDAFSYDLDSYMTGRAEYQFAPGELSGGVHQAEAMAWDAANNPNTAQVAFEVLAGGELGLADLLNYPNPFSGTTRFTFRLTEAPALVSIKVYTVAGRLVKEFRDVPVDDVYDVNNPHLVWDGRDEEGDLLSNGVYLYKILAESADGRSAEEIGKLMFLR
ncbi:MAG TPA: T9SS type A sorting domain-containing protein, partial [bacterium]